MSCVMSRSCHASVCHVCHVCPYVTYVICHASCRVHVMHPGPAWVITCLSRSCHAFASRMGRNMPVALPSHMAVAFMSRRHIITPRMGRNMPAARLLVRAPIQHGCRFHIKSPCRPWVETCRSRSLPIAFPSNMAVAHVKSSRRAWVENLPVARRPGRVPITHDCRLRVKSSCRAWVETCQSRVLPALVSRSSSPGIVICSARTCSIIYQSCPSRISTRTGHRI